MNKDVNDDEFVSMMTLWVIKNGTYPLELITFLRAKNEEKIIAIPQYVDPDEYLYLGAKSYATYQSALTKVGALMDKMNYSEALQIFKENHPLSVSIAAQKNDFYQ